MITAPGGSPAPDVAPVSFEKARELERAGDEQGAFRAYLAIPGAEWAAARLGRARAAEFLPLVRGEAGPRTILVEGDLLLAMGRKSEALERYRQAASRIARQGEGWAQGFVPAGTYLVEPADSEMSRLAIAAPFTAGPGSHRDNWLLRRFIALEAWDDAAREFARVWEIHRLLARPYLDVGPDPQTGKAGTRLFRPAGFDGLGLEFALDYAFFLKRQKEDQKALAALMEPLSLMDMDRNPNELSSETAPPGTSGSSPGEAHAPPSAAGSPAPAATSALSRPAFVLPARGTGRWGTPRGISRKAFIRLAYGAFKSAGRESALCQALEDQVAAGRNAARRLLARIRWHQGREEEALALELEYIGAGAFDEPTIAFRSGLAYEDARLLEKSAAAYERFLAAPFRPMRLPDRDEEEVQREMQSQMIAWHPDAASPEAHKGLRDDVFQRLIRLYSALGQPARVDDVRLRQLAASPTLMGDPDHLSEMRKRLETPAARAQFVDLLTSRVATADPATRASLCWVLGDPARAARALGEMARARPSPPGAFQDWKRRFDGVGKLRLLLETLVAADPHDAVSHAELMDLRGPWPPAEAIPVLATLLERDAVELFRRGKGARNPTRFRNAFDIAYRLMRCYEKTGQLDRLRALGLRLARGGKPFHAPDFGQHEYRDANEIPEDVHACLSLLVQHADTTKVRAELEKVLVGRPWPWSAALAQLHRRSSAAPSTASKPTGWANALPGARILTCQENVLSLAVDASRIYAGHPWGVAVYTHAGRLVTRVALEEAAQDLLVQGKTLWAATPKGLFRIPTGDGTFRPVAHLFLDGDLPASERGSSDSDVARHNRACALAADGPFVWIGTARNVQRLDTRTGALRVYLPEELGETSPCEWSRFLVDGDVLWVDGEKGCRRYDRATDTWSSVTYQRKPVRLVALQDGILWGHVWLNDELRDRPCLIDRSTLEVTPILIQEGSPSDRCINGPFALYGKWRGHPVLGPGSPAFYYDAAIRRLRPLPQAGESPVEVQSDLPAGLRSGFAWRRPDGIVRCQDQTTSRHRLASGVPFFAGAWSAARLPGGDLVVAGQRERSPRFEYPGEDRPEAYETWDEEAGLYLVPAGDGTAASRRGIRRISDVAGSDALPGDDVLAVVPAAKGGLWVATSRGLVRIDSGGQVVDRYTRADGLCANQVRGVVVLAGKVYLATGWGDSGGGLAVLDPKTRVFTSLGQADGMDTDNLESISLVGNRLRLVYASEYLRGSASGDHGYRRFPPGTFDPATGRFGSGGAPVLMTQTQAAATEPRPEGQDEPMPYLGGRVWRRAHLGKATVLCGTRGMVILEAGHASPLTIADITPAHAMSPLQRQTEEAQAIPLARPASFEDLKGLLGHANPYVRARALEECERTDLLARADVLSAIGACAADPNLRVRATAVLLLARIARQAGESFTQDARDGGAGPKRQPGTAPSPQDARDGGAAPKRQPGTAPSTQAVRDGGAAPKPSLATDPRTMSAVVPPLKVAAQDVDPRIRAVAAIALASLGEAVDPARFEEILADARTWRTLPFGLRSERGVDSDLEHVYRALAPRADAAVFTLLVRHPLPVDDYEPRVKVMSWLGASLRRHPDAAAVLLGARGREAVAFAQAVFVRAGLSLLPALHQGLASDDRVVRSNAARACGALRDPASVPLLVRAGGLESGLSRASVVWALGELKATEALPLLVSLYGDARADEERRRGSGYRMAQQNAVVASQYESLRSLDAIGADWDELKAVAAPPRVDPAGTEDLLEPREIMEAVRKIGPEASQAFYRTLAGDRHSDARYEAAACLVDAPPLDRAASLAILRGLLADTDTRVQVSAAVSLLILGETSVEPRILEWLASPEEWNKREVLTQLARVKDPVTLSFARAPLAECARKAALEETRAAAAALLKRMR